MAECFAGFSLVRVGEVPLLWRSDSRFKTLRVSLCLQRPLDDRAAARSLLPNLLLQGTARDTDRPALARRMERLYGATAAPVTFRLGESHILRFTLDAVSGDFLPGRPDQLCAGLDFLADFAVRPLLDDGRFPEETFQRKRRHAADSVRALFDEKGAYAKEQALQQACAGEPLGIPEHGGLPAIEALCAADPETARRDFLERGQPWLLAMGALAEDELVDRLGNLMTQLPENRPEPVPPAVRIPRRASTSTTERVELQQSKMILVFRFGTQTEAAGWAARVLMVNMLGGGPHARLFREVREKKSLAYYAGAGLDRHKGLMLVQVGLDEASAERVGEETLAQIRGLAEGGADQEELETAKATVTSSLATVEDAPASAMSFVSEQWLLGEDHTTDQKIQLHRDVSAAAVVEAAQDLWLDHSYLLAPQRDGGAADD
jgi:predicted Zn-dependent peptidase